MGRVHDACSAHPFAHGGIALAVAFGLAACDRKDEPAPVAPSPTSSASGRVDPHRKVPPAGASGGAVPGSPARPRSPDWGLDPRDAAKDYVARYLRATKRYGAQTACVVVRPSSFTEGRSIVETRNDESGTCGKADDLRDRFFVFVATDRLSLDPSLHQPKLQKWPDGSDPEGPPGPVADLQDLRGWKTPLHDAFRQLQLVPLRLQAYGRGTFPVISLAGWHGPVLENMTPGQLEAPARTLCEANNGEPLGIFAGFDRTTFLRISCPASAQFESL